MNKRIQIWWCAVAQHPRSESIMHESIRATRKASKEAAREQFIGRTVTNPELRARWAAVFDERVRDGLISFRQVEVHW